jgi:biopolymer transport protein ExbD
MAFSSQSDDEVLSEINITPLVDVMLVLLVAFIVTAPLLNNAIKVTLPKTAATAAPDTPKALNLSVDVAGSLFLDQVPVASTGLEAELRRRQAAAPQLTLHLQADERVPYGAVAKAMAAIERAGITRIAVLTARER